MLTPVIGLPLSLSARGELVVLVWVKRNDAPMVNCGDQLRPHHPRVLICIQSSTLSNHGGATVYALG